MEARLTGPARSLGVRLLAGGGWSVAAMTTPGGLGAFVAGPVSEFTDRVVPAGTALRLDEPALVRAVCAEQDEAARVDVLASTLEAAADPERAVAARQWPPWRRWRSRIARCGGWRT